MGTYTGTQAHNQGFYNSLCSNHVTGYTPYWTVKLIKLFLRCF